MIDDSAPFWRSLKISFVTLYTILTIQLIITYCFLMVALKVNLDEAEISNQRTFFKWVMGIFVVNYFCKSIYNIFSGNYENLLSSMFVRQLT